MKKLIKAILATSIFLLVPTSLAGTLDSSTGSYYSVSRPGVVIDGFDHFNYPTFNNFTGNPVIDGDGYPFNGDERQFTVVKKCGSTCTILSPYRDQLNNLQAGDKIRFVVYFHNNGADPFDEIGMTSDPAENVNIGIDIRESIQYSDGNPDTLRPKGFIYADNNRYKKSSGESRRYEENDYIFELSGDEGDIAKTASDDIRLTFASDDLELELLDDITVQMESGLDHYITVPINGPTILPFLTENGIPIPILATPKLAEIDNGRIWLNLGALPGCFRYSGFVFFDAIVKAPPVEECKNIVPYFTNYYHTTWTDIFRGDVIRFRPISYDTNGDPYFDATPPSFPARIKYTALKILGIPPAPTINTALFGSSPTQMTLNPYTADQGDNVFMKAIKAGTDVVTLDTLDTDVPTCTLKYDILEPECKNIDVTVTELDGTPIPNLNTYDTSPNQILKFSATAPAINDHPSNPVDFDGDIQYQINTNKGCFAKFAYEALLSTPSNPFGSCTNNLQNIEQGDPVFLKVWEPGNNAIRVDTMDTNVQACTKWFDLNMAKCESLEISPAGPLYVDDPNTTAITLTALNTNGNPLPGSTKIVWDGTNAGGSTMSANLPAIPDLFVGTSPLWANTLPNNIFLDPGSPSGRITVSIDPNDPLYSLKCRDSIKIEPVCETLTITPPGPFSPTALPQLLTLSGTDTDGNPLPPLVRTLWDRITTVPPTVDVTSIFGSVFNVISQLIGVPINSQFTLTQGIAGDIVTVGIHPNSPYYGKDADVCEAQFEITAAPVCTELDVNITETDSPLPVQVTDLEPGTWYTISADALYSGPVTNTITLSSEYGVFVENTAVPTPYNSLDYPTGEDFQSVIDPAVHKGAVGTPAVVTVNEGDIIYFVTYSDLNASVVDALQIEATAPYNVEPCVTTYDIITELVCEEINLSVTETASPLPVQISTLEVGTWYTLTADVTYSNPAYNNDVTYSSSYGVFVDATMVPGTYNPVSHPTAEDLEGLTGVIAPSSIGGTPAEITVPEGSTVYFVTYTAIPADVAVALTSTATDREEPVCSTFLPLVVPEVPEPCQNIVVTYSDSPFDGTQDTTIYVTPGDFGDFTGNFRFSTNPQTPNTGVFLAYDEVSTPSLAGSPREFTQAQVAGGIYYFPGTDSQADDDIVIESVGELSSLSCAYTITGQNPPEEVTCESLEITEPPHNWDEGDLDDNGDEFEQKFKIEVESSPAGHEGSFIYKWRTDDNVGEWRHGTPNGGQTVTYNSFTNWLEEIDENDLDDEFSVTIWAEDEDGNAFSACRDTVEFNPEDEDSTPPRIRKAVYDPGKGSKGDWRETINISGKDGPDYITYMIDFKAGSATSAEIWDAAIENGKIDGNQNGEFVFEGMVIAAKADSDRFVLYRSEDDNFDEDRYKNIDIDGSKAIDDFDDYDDPDIDDYADDYECPENDDEICIENDFDDIEDTFSDGDQIEFKLGREEVDYIYIVYQFRNETVIDDAFCEDLTEDEGCGEQFDNKAHFEAEDDEAGDDWDGDDEARVVVICPYVLTRSGGDTFFHDAIDTGADVNRCAEVQNTPLIITPRPIPDQYTPQTGQDGQPIIELTTPTHDVCKLSNDTNDTDIPQEYRNVLKNFSSSVCELKADVAEQWHEANIVNGLLANVTRIARWQTGNNLLATLRSVPNDQKNGVFYTKTDLTISGGVLGLGNFKIKANGETPAAQTYIVQNANLYIKDNIKYDDSRFDPVNPRSIPSAAFIVIDGNILVDNNVKELDGIFIAVDTDDVGNDGKIMADPETVTKNILTVKGSLIGDVFSLFTNRKGIGDLFSDEGSVTIRYDQRILLNTPPGLSELLDISQLRSAN